MMKTIFKKAAAGGILLAGSLALAACGGGGGGGSYEQENRRRIQTPSVEFIRLSAAEQIFVGFQCFFRHDFTGKRR